MAAAIGAGPKGGAGSPATLDKPPVAARAARMPPHTAIGVLGAAPPPAPCRHVSGAISGRFVIGYNLGHSVTGQIKECVTLPCHLTCGVTGNGRIGSTCPCCSCGIARAKSTSFAAHAQ